LGADRLKRPRLEAGGLKKFVRRADVKVLPETFLGARLSRDHAKVSGLNGPSRVANVLCRVSTAHFLRKYKTEDVDVIGIPTCEGRG
jgi:hypothetical protein